MKKTALLACLSLLSALLWETSLAWAASLSCQHPWAFFDLGATLVDTKNDSFQNMTHTPGAHAYLHELARRGYRLGLLINWPVDEGRTQQEKASLMRAMIDQDWAIDEPPFDWSIFEPEAVIFPMTIEERKPNPALFMRALMLNEPRECALFFQGEDPAEVHTAQSLGLRSYQVGREGMPFFLSADEMDQLSGRPASH